MARKRRRKAAENISMEEKMTRSIAMVAVKGLETEEAAARLLGMGFDALDISKMLFVNKNYANMAKGRWKKKMKKKSKAAAKE